MQLKQLSLVNFKNYADFEATFCRRMNCFVGNNGVGKTNLLDAIHYLSFCKSYFNTVDSHNIRYNENFFVIRGLFDHDGEDSEVYCGLKRNQKKVFKRNNKEYDRLSEHIGQYPIVMITPGDSELIYGSSEYRRKFMDGIISQYNRVYLDKLISYNQVVKQRNALLKQFAEKGGIDSESLEVWDDQLCTYGKALLEERYEFLKQFMPYFTQYYKFISGHKEEVTLEYENSLRDKDLKTGLLTSIHRDQALQYTTLGPHRDDLEFKLDGNSLKKFASQGQQKSYLVALKLAQYDFIRSKKNQKPLLLLDDVYDKLDEERFTRLLELVSGENFGQVFITDTHPDRIEHALLEKAIENRVFVIGESETIKPQSHS